MKPQTTDQTPIQKRLEDTLSDFSNYDVLAKARNKDTTKIILRQSSTQFVMLLTSYAADVEADVIDAASHSLIKKFKSQKKALSFCETPDSPDDLDESMQKRNALTFTKDLLEQAMNEIFQSKSPAISSKTRENLASHLQPKKDFT